MKTFKQYVKTQRPNSGNLHPNLGIPEEPAKDTDRKLIVVGDQISLDSKEVQESSLDHPHY